MDANVDLIRDVRRFQRQYFGSRKAEVLEALRPLERQLRAEIKDYKTTDPEVWHVVETATSMLTYQQAWMESVTFERSIPASATQESRDKAAAKVRRLEATCRSLEKKTDEAIDRLERPQLPGLGL